MACLEALSHDPANTVLIVSGRDHQLMEEWLGTLNIGIAAEHGAFLR